jgi:AcrR family transcriptional regulator
MGRTKTIADEDLLAVARTVFLEHGHGAPTRDIARLAGVSEAVLYQRFGNKNVLFFAAMKPELPDVAAIAGPEEPVEDAPKYVVGALDRMARYFAEILPRVMQMMMHPDSSVASLLDQQPTDAAEVLERAVSVRLASLERRGRIGAGLSRGASRLLTSLAHDAGIRATLSGSRVDRADIAAMVDVIMRGLGPQESATNGVAEPAGPGRRARTSKPAR